MQPLIHSPPLAPPLEALPFLCHSASSGYASPTGPGSLWGHICVPPVRRTMCGWTFPSFSAAVLKVTWKIHLKAQKNVLFKVSRQVRFPIHSYWDLSDAFLLVSTMWYFIFIAVLSWTAQQQLPYFKMHWTILISVFCANVTELQENKSRDHMGPSGDGWLDHYHCLLVLLINVGVVGPRRLSIGIPHSLCSRVEFSKECLGLVFIWSLIWRSISIKYLLKEKEWF